MTNTNEKSDNEKPSIILTQEAEELINNYLEETSSLLINLGVSSEETEKTISELSNHIKELCGLKSKGKVVTTDTVEKILKKLGPPNELNIQSFSTMTPLSTDSFLQNNSSKQQIRKVNQNKTNEINNTIITNMNASPTLSPVELVTDYFNALSRTIFLFSFVFMFPFLLVLIPEDIYFFNGWGKYFGLVISIQSFLIIIYLVSLFLYYLSPVKKEIPGIIPQNGSYFAYTFLIQSLFVVIDDFYFELADTLYILVYYVFVILTLFVLFIGIVELRNNILAVRNSKIYSSS